MNIAKLHDYLGDSNPEIVVSALRLVGLVEETTLFDAVRAAYMNAANDDVKLAADWAGRRLHAAKQRQHTTLDAIFDFFGIDREIANSGTEEEERLLKDLDAQMQNEMMRRNQDAAGKKLMWSAGAAALGGMVGGAAVGGMMFNSGMAAGADMASSNISGQRIEGMSTQRAPAPRPSDLDVRVWVKRLRSDANPDKRRGAAMELASMNNPTALHHFGMAFQHETVPAVQAAIEQYGKVLYWKQAYWQLTEDGTIEAEVSKRRAAKPPPKAQTTPLSHTAADTGPTDTPQRDEREDIAKILKQAEAKKRQARRKKRRKKRR